MGSYFQKINTLLFINRELQRLASVYRPMRLRQLFEKFPAGGNKRIDAYLALAEVVGSKAS